MWADEALFTAKIQPMRIAGTLVENDINRLHDAIREVLTRGIRLGGATVDTYRLPDGESGQAHTEFKVAHRRGEDCLVCGSPLEYIKVRGRGTCFCSKCQS